MRRLITATIAILISSAAFAKTDPIDYRRTLVVPVGQKILWLEAPLGMCFLDQSSQDQNAFFKSVADDVAVRGGQTLLAVFMGCMDTVNTRGFGGILPGVGIVTWLNPSVGEATGLPRADYLDMREASFPQYAENNARGLHPDASPRRTESSIAIGMTGDMDEAGQKYKSAAVLATTSIRNVPVEVTLRYNGNTPPALDGIYTLVDKFMAQQIALNE